MKLFVSILLLIAILAIPGLAQDVPPAIDGFVPRVFQSAGNGSLPYRLFVPDNYDPNTRYPLILWLHGAGGAGTDNVRQISEDQILGTRLWTMPEIQEQYPAFVVAPQSPGIWISRGLDQISPELMLVLEILDSLKAEFSIDSQRLYVMGQSDGGYGTWNLITQRPGLFAAAIPVCGGGDPGMARRIATLPLWVFHGERDGTVLVTESRRMVEALKKAGGHPRYTEYGSVGHDVWKRVFTDPDLPEWLFSQHR